MKACVIIPARFKSSRFPGKPLVKLKGKEMILWVAELSTKAVNISNVFVATDDLRISKLVEKNGYNSILTSQNSLTGTDRVAEAVEGLDYEVIVNVQGDEPLVNPIDIRKAIDLKIKFPKSIFNSYCAINKTENPMSRNIPKVIFNEKNDLIYISRALIPESKNNLKNYVYNKQVCIYSYNKNELLKFKNFGRKSRIEKIEDIEILRFLELGINIKMFEASSSSLAVDIPSDVAVVEKALSIKK